MMALVVPAFTAQAESFNQSAVANDAQLLAAVLAAGRAEPSERWLEAACGPGVISRRLAPKVRSVHGIDLTPAMIDLARREASNAGIENITFEVADATQTSLAAASFDGAVTRFSLHHLPLPGRLFEELVRLVRPGGTIIVLDHVADDDGGALSWSQEIERLRDPSHWACLSAGRLRDLGRKAGLKLEDERIFAYELDFDDWLRRGSADEDAQALVERSLAQGPPAPSDCFSVAQRGGGRVLTLRMWLSRWRR